MTSTHAQKPREIRRSRRKSPALAFLASFAIWAAALAAGFALPHYGVGRTALGVVSAVGAVAALVWVVLLFRRFGRRRASRLDRALAYTAAFWGPLIVGALFFFKTGGFPFPVTGELLIQGAAAICLVTTLTVLILTFGGFSRGGRA